MLGLLGSRLGPMQGRKLLINVVLIVIRCIIGVNFIRWSFGHRSHCLLCPIARRAGTRPNGTARRLLLDTVDGTGVLWIFIGGLRSAQRRRESFKRESRQK